MANFRHVLNAPTKAIVPEYRAQWYDRVYEYESPAPDVDYIEAGYPNSTANRQITDSPYRLDGTTNEGAILTIQGGIVIATIAGTQMRLIL